MLSEKRIKELEILSGVGKEAQETLNNFYALQGRLEELTSILETCDKCYRIEFNNGYCTRTIQLEEKEKGAEVLKQLIQIEIDNINSNLEGFK